MLKLYYSPGACSLAAHIVLEEIGIRYELEVVNSSGPVEARKTASQQWRAINPKGRVPALLGVPGRIGGTPNLLTEVHAILFFLARTNPSVGLLPADPIGEARCIEWMNWLASNVHAMSFGQIWRAERFLSDQSLFAAVNAKGKQNLVEQYAYIESLLSDGREWAVPGSYSIVEPYLLVFYYWGTRIGLDMKTTAPAWTDLIARVRLRPAVARTLAQEGLSLQ